MRISSALLVLILAAGCGKGGKDKGSTSDTGQTTIPSIAFKSQAQSGAIAGEIDPTSLLAHQATNVALGAIGLAAADAAVREGMTSHATTSGRSSHCWNGPIIPRSTFTLDYTYCTQAAISGGLVYNQDPLGPITLDFKPVTFDLTRSINGALGFDHDEDVMTPLHWRVYDTDADLPSPDTSVPVAVEVDGQQLMMDFDGGAFMQGVNQKIAVWGVLDFTPYLGEPMQVLVGGADASALRTWDDPADATTMPWNYLSCRCPQQGLTVLDLAFLVEEVTFDLDDLQEEDDGIDDPVVAVSTSVELTGKAEVRPTTCGEWEMTFDAGEGIDVEVSSEELKTGIQTLCDTAIIQEPGQCTALLKAAGDVDSVTIKVGANKLSNSVQDEASVALDTAYCIPI